MKLKKILILVLLVIFVFSSVGCQKSRPDDVKENIWYNGKETYLIIKDIMQKAQKNYSVEMDRENHLKVNEFVDKYFNEIITNPQDYTPTETEIITNIFDMNLSYLNYSVNMEKGKKDEANESLETFNKSNAELKDIFGE